MLCRWATNALLAPDASINLKIITTGYSETLVTCTKLQVITPQKTMALTPNEM